MITVAMFRTRFPEFTTLVAADARVQQALDDATLSLNPNAWGKKYDLGQAYLAAHLLSIELANAGAAGGAGASVGQVTQEAVGEVSHSFATLVTTQGSSNTVDDFALTRYGVRYLSLRREVVASPLVL